MTTLTCNPGRDCVNSLGIPVDNLTVSSAVQRIVELARAGDGRARLVSTLNVDFLVNSLGTALSRPRHPELLEVLRSSDLVTADGFPIVWLSRLLGRPLQARVCGSDLVPALAERAVREGLSLFLLGGAEGVAADAATRLQSRYPGLRIAGSAAPMVQTSGPGLAGTVDADTPLLEQIHESGADILLVGLGNPKQELWFNRNRSALRTPVSIGVGGSFEFITGNIQRAPASWQRLNLEWVYRITQDPGRLTKRYMHGIFKLALLATPVLWARFRETLHLTRAKAPESIALRWKRLWSSRQQSIALLRLPSVLGVDYMQRVVLEISQQPVTTDELRILDFSRVKRIALDAQQEFFNLSALLQQQRGRLQLMGLSARVRRQLAAARLIDLLDGDSHDAVQKLTQRNRREAGASCQSYSLANTTLVTLSGRVSRDGLAALGFVECLLHSVRNRRCIIDFRNVDLLESSGIAELMPLFQLDTEDRSEVLLSGVGHGIRQMLRMSDIDCHARIIDDQALLNYITEEDKDA